jgi:hypothetical protein
MIKLRNLSSDHPNLEGGMNAVPVVSECFRLVNEQIASSEREMGDVRAILEDAIARLIQDRSSATALQFQDIADQLLAHASARLQALRVEMDRARDAVEARHVAPVGVAHAMYDSLLALSKQKRRPVHSADLEPGTIEFF